jgi:hypothetical protein
MFGLRCIYKIIRYLAGVNERYAQTISNDVIVQKTSSI